MNSILMKALVDNYNNELQKQKYADEFNALEQKYRDSVEKAYGLNSANDFIKEGTLGRAADVITSNILGALGVDRVNVGRAGMRAMNPLLVRLIRSQGFKDAFQGAREAEMQIPGENDITGTLNYFDTVRQMGNIPYSPRDKRLRPVALSDEAINKQVSAKEKYGY